MRDGARQIPQHGNAIVDALLRLQADAMGQQRNRVSLKKGSLLFAAHEAIDAVYFPLDAVVALSNSDAADRTAAVALCGQRDLLGVGLALASPVSIHNAVVVVKGDALKLERRDFEREILDKPTLRRFVMRYAHALMTQISFTSVCERIHIVEQRLVRWLLLGSDPTGGAPFDVTQDTLAALMGARRESVTLAANKLQSEGLIRYRRGEIDIIDRRRLEERTCQCYREILSGYERLFAPEKEPPGMMPPRLIA